MTRVYFGTDGIRGKVGEHPITPDFVLKLGWATGRVFARENQHRHGVIIGKDTRISGYMFEAALEAGLAAAGVNTQLLGPMPTPAVAYLARTFRAQAGIVISASHNPFYDNGIKFFGPDGLKLPDEVELRIEEQLGQPMTTVESGKIGKATRVTDAAGRYIEFCKSTIPPGIDFSGLKLVVDCANGSTYHVAPPVFEEVGATVIPIGVQPNGLNINDGVGATKPEYLARAVLENEAALGIALDGDGDRLIMVDHSGEVLDGDEILYIIARSRQADGYVSGPIIGTKMSNLGLEHAINELGLDFARAAVGDRYVMEMMLARGSMLGGEGSGHIICRDKIPTGDGIVSALQVMSAMHTANRTLNELKKGMRKYPQCLINVRITDRGVNLDAIESISKIKREIEGELVGCGRVLLRASGTEPLVRVMVEGQNANHVEALANRLATAVGQAFGA